MRRVLISGSRGWKDWQEIVDAIVNELFIDADLTIVHGACGDGADFIADRVAARAGIKTERHPAQWRRYGAAAGPIRNHAMAKLGADVMHAFVLDNSRGTSNCIREAKKAGIPVIEHRYTTEAP